MKHINFQTALSILGCLIIILFSASILQAQPTDPEPASTIPIDGGVGVLMAVGATYGIKKMRDLKKK